MQFFSLTHGTLILEDTELADGLLVVGDGRIEYAGPYRAELLPPGCVEVDVRGYYVAPGFIDLHVHGGAGADFMDATDEAVESILRYHLQHGTTAYMPTTATEPLDRILKAIDAIERYRKNSQPYGRVLGVHIEGPYLAPTKKGCHRADWLRLPEESEWKQILERGKIGRMTLAPELPGARPLVEALVRKQAVASAGHSEALYHEMMEAVGWGITHVTHLYSVMTSAMNNRWRGTRNPRSGGILEAVYLHEELTSELITDGVHLAAEVMQLALRIKGHQGLAIVTDAMRAAGMPDGEYSFGSIDGTIAEVANGEARVKGDVALASSVVPMNEMVKRFWKLTGCRLWQAVHMASLTPARIAGVENQLGSLKAGKLADILVLNSELGVEQVYLGGRRVL